MGPNKTDKSIRGGKSKLQVAKAKITELEGKCKAPVQSASGCNFDKELVAFEKAAHDLASRGKTIKKLSLAELPEYPLMSFKVNSGGTNLVLQIDDPENFYEQTLEATRGVNKMLGLAGSAFKLAFPCLKKVEGLGKYYPSILNVLNLARDKAARYMKSNSEKNERGIPEFIILMSRTLQSSRDIRYGIICTTKLQTKRFYKGYEKLEKTKDKLRTDVDANKACTANNSSKKETYLNLISLKAKAVRGPNYWIKNSKLSMYIGSARNHLPSGGWIDKEVIWNQADCRGYKLKNMGK